MVEWCHVPCQVTWVESDQNPFTPVHIYIACVWEREYTKKDIIIIIIFITSHKGKTPYLEQSTCFSDFTLPNNKSFLWFVSLGKVQGWLLLSYLFTFFCHQILTGSIRRFSCELCSAQELPTSKWSTFSSRSMVCPMSSAKCFTIPTTFSLRIKIFKVIMMSW